MLPSHPLVFLFLLCVTSAAMSQDSLTLGTHQSAPEEERRGNAVVRSERMNGSGVDVVHGSPGERVGDANSTKRIVEVGFDGNDPAELDPISDVGPASEKEGDPAPKEEAGQASEQKPERDSQEEVNPVQPVEENSDWMSPGGESTGDTHQHSVSADTRVREDDVLSFDEDERTGKILAYYTTKVKNLFATTTVSRLSTCFSATNTPQCMGRRKKRHLDRNIDASIFDLEGSESLHGTVADPVEPNYDSSNRARGDRDPRKFTVWSTMFSTFTLTSTYYYPGTTVTVSGVCVLPGLGSGCFG